MSGQTIELPVWETITSAWEKTSGTKGSFWAGLGILFAIMFGIGILQGLTEQGAPAVSFVFSVIGNVVGYFCQLGLIYMGIRRAKGDSIDFKLMFYPFNLQLALMLVGLYILQILIFIIPGAIAGLGIFLASTNEGILSILGVLLIIPAILGVLVIGIRLSLSMAFVLDTGSSPVNAIKSSLKATNGNFWNLVGLFLLQVIIIGISMLPLGIGLIWTLPFGFICYGLIYQRLRINC